MNNIVLCKNTKCESRDDCFRFVAKTQDPNQVYSLFEGHKERCSYFLDQNKAEKGIIDSLGIYPELLKIVKGERK